MTWLYLLIAVGLLLVGWTVVFSATFIHWIVAMPGLVLIYAALIPLYMAGKSERTLP